MTQVQNVFERYEKKYLLNTFQYAALEEWLQDKMREDIFGRYTICNLYYDTPDYQLIRKSLDKPVYKEKLRLRSYGTPEKETQVFLELKKKFKGVVYKRRTSFSLGQAMKYLNTGERPNANDQILNEIDWFSQTYRPQAKVFIGYDRIALSGIEDPQLRMTFDTAIRWRDTLLDLSKGDWGLPLLAEGSILLEIKIPGAMPLWLCHILDRLQIYPVSFSKYGTCYEKYLSKSMQIKGGMICA